jgi:hypothetical protein
VATTIYDPGATGARARKADKAKAVVKSTSVAKATPVTKAKLGLTPVELARRERVFRVYRDLGPSRTYKRLNAAIAQNEGTIAARLLNAWSAEHSWKERVREHDDRLAAAAGSTINAEYKPDYDIEEALLHSAQIALDRALSANVEPQNPHQVKALIDAAINALRAVENRQSGRKTGAELAGGVKRVAVLLDKIEARIRASHAIQEGRTIDGEATDVTPLALAAPETDEQGKELEQQAGARPAPAEAEASADESDQPHGSRPEPGPAEPHSEHGEHGEHGEQHSEQVVEGLTFAQRLALRKR